VKEGAETVHTRLQAKAESVGFKPINPDGRERKGRKHLFIFIYREIINIYTV
jgi:hypothetical protein